MSKVVPFSGTFTQVDISDRDIEKAILDGAHLYFDECRSNVPTFVDRCFHYPGAVATNKVAWGWDILLAPVNLVWAPFYALICVIRFMVPKSTRLHCFLQQTPAGFTTQVQRHISNLVMSDLLKTNERESAFERHLLSSLQDLYGSHIHDHIGRQEFRLLIEPLVADALKEYQVTRTASADITNSLSCTIFGAFAFQKFTPGAIGITFLLASLLVKEMAVRNFLLGDTLGSFYYGLFPPEPSLVMTGVVMGSVMVMLAVVAALSGIIIDPIQAALGLHRKRLMKMIDHLEQDFIEKTSSTYRPKDQFIARIMDAFDMIKSGLV